MIVVDLISATGCKWSNEGCFSNQECCSNGCSLRHPGTEPRCEKSSILGPCLYNYHCERNFICGPKNKCCSDYWNDCRDETECCDPAHVCLYARGFVYKKCLFGPVQLKSMAPVTNKLSVICLLSILFLYIHHF